MLFTTNGPDIPEKLLQAHEEGRVVFFCGAGISYPAGLPGFGGLVNQIYAELGTSRTPIEDQAYRKDQYDATLELLERRYPGQRLAVRTALAKVLKPKLRRKGAIATHEALLKLATDRKGKVRLVTTNFDRIFQYLIARRKLAIPSFAAPLLPIPKPSRWHGVVHLHGLMPDSFDETILNRLILTSGDFGLAYLTERWAARFVSELFRNYTVCFIGYSINDPVLRYMMDALAVDEMLGEPRQEAYAFGSFNVGGREQAHIEWEARSVTPLLYEVPVGTQDHSALHMTLKEWADTHHDGVRGKEMIIAQHATTPPLTSSRLDYAVGRVLWALTDGLAAKHFANLNPVPPLEWLAPLAELQFRHEDLSRFGISPMNVNDDKLSFSVIRRPAPYTLAPWMYLAGFGLTGSVWDEVMEQLARWLTRHLNDPQLVLWIVKQSGQLHERLSWLVHRQIEHIDKLEREGKQEDINRIRSEAPNAVPCPLMRTLWRLLLSGRVKTTGNGLNLYDWLRRVKQEGCTPILRMELREILAPRIEIREPFRHELDEVQGNKSQRIKDLVEWDLVLTCDHVHSVLNDSSINAIFQRALPDFLQDFSGLLRDSLDLMRELDGADDLSDLSYIVQPSICDHPQNSNLHEWSALIDLTRDAWLSTLKTSPDKAMLVAKEWWLEPYPLFKRLAFFAATQGNVIAPRQSLDWLKADRSWWLWSVETEREAMRLLVMIAPQLDAAELIDLEHAILQGPPREMFKDDIETEHWTSIVDREIWLRLAKVKSAGATLSQTAKARMKKLGKKYPEWRLAQDERDEFPYWSGDGSEWRKFGATPRRRRDLVEWLQKNTSRDYWQDDDWRQRCRDDFPATSCALFALAGKHEWPVNAWREALQAWAEDKLLKLSWRYAARIITAAPDSLIQELSHSLGWWLQAQAKSFKGQEMLFLGLIDRVLGVEYEERESSDDPVSRAINHPIGLVTEALLRWWYKTEPKDDQGLLDEIKSIFTRICDTKIKTYCHGRVLLATHAISLFRVDATWTTEYLLPLFDWQRSETEARAAWEGFLWSPRLYRPLMAAIKQQLLTTANHYGQLGKHAEQYAAFLTFAALEPGDTFTQDDLKTATSALPKKGLHGVAKALVRALEGAGEQRDEYWRNRMLPYLKFIWPKSRDIITQAISESLARLCIAAQDAFPDALRKLKYWLMPPEYPEFTVHLLYNANLCEQFPKESLEFLDIVIGNPRWLPGDLNKCLDSIRIKQPGLTTDQRFIRLSELLRLHDR